MSARRQVLVKFPLDEFEAIERARGATDRSTWIRQRLAEAIARTSPDELHEQLTARQHELQRTGKITRW